jgi:hypothetical protein
MFAQRTRNLFHGSDARENQYADGTVIFGYFADEFQTAQAVAQTSDKLHPSNGAWDGSDSNCAADVDSGHSLSFPEQPTVMGVQWSCDRDILQSRRQRIARQGLKITASLCPVASTQRLALRDVAPRTQTWLHTALPNTNKVRCTDRLVLDSTFNRSSSNM